MEQKKKGQPKKRRNEKMINFCFVICLVLSIVIGISSYSITKKNKEYVAEREKLEEQLEQEKKRSDDIADLEEYVGSKEYVEQIARDKLGLVYPNEIIFKVE